MYLLNIHIHKYSRILLTKQRIFAISIHTNANINFQVSLNIHIREYILVLHSSRFPAKRDLGYLILVFGVSVPEIISITGLTSLSVRLSITNLLMATHRLLPQGGVRSALLCSTAVRRCWLIL